MKIVAAKPLPAFHVHLVFDDGTAGDVDLSEHAGKGVFQAWRQPGVFERVIVTKNGAISWPGDLDLCADSLYLKLTRKQPEDIFPSLRRAATHA